ncbi:hypothetical protein FOJ82_08025 [Tessaracoccus rhinocerotis]|uniref:Uncharacterized protein n=1 Tax=Tessaracoccus rhinocerotis TaxID=1689449 RepID=A0A553K2V4_9ACTN|nr:hypothetical protein [Tessaracoccus rhinocerotis]TRY19036.1 hypothetical protein FOJ82_08025 [Tessaracoccus rhinocerotis]
MGAQGVRRWSAGLLVVMLPMLGAWLGAPTAEAAHHDGPCTDASGVTVVVDHQELGGGVVVRCAQDFPPTGGTGLQALQLAGFIPAGTVKDGASFVCRINNRPAADEDLTVGGQAYRENCIATPPDGAFWSYWHAKPGGQWTFSQLGAARSVQPGGYEGWSFSLGRTEGSNPPPGVKPAAIPESEPSQRPTSPAPPAPPGTTTAPAPSTVAPPAPTTANPAPPASSSSASTKPEPTASGTTSRRTPSPTPTSKPAPTPTAAGSTSTSAGPTPSVTVSPSPETVGDQVRESTTPEPSATESAPTVAATTSGGGPGMGTFVGLSAVAGIAAAGGVVWWRRRNLV